MLVHVLHDVLKWVLVIYILEELSELLIYSARVVNTQAEIIARPKTHVLGRTHVNGVVLWGGNLHV